MPKLSIQVAIDEIEHGADEDRIVHLPAKYEICSTCRGTGGHSLRFGAITQRDREEWDDDSFEAYMRGDYDEKCEDCEGSGKVLVDHQHRTAAQQARQHRIRLAGVIERRIAGEHHLDVRRIVEVHHGAQPRHLQREHAAVALPAGLHESWPVAQEHCGLNDAGQRRPRGSFSRIAPA